MGYFEWRDKVATRYFEWAGRVATHDANTGLGWIVGIVVGGACLATGFSIGGVGGAILGLIVGYFLGAGAGISAARAVGFLLILVVPAVAIFGTLGFVVWLIWRLWGFGR